MVLRGWPLSYFINPSSFKTKDDLEAVRDALLSETCHFAKITEHELHKLKVQQARLQQQGKIDDADAVGVERVGGNADIDTSQGAAARSTNSRPPRLPSPPHSPIPTFQSVFPAAPTVPTGYEGIEPSLWPPSAYSGLVPEPSLAAAGPDDHSLSLPLPNHQSPATPLPAISEAPLTPANPDNVEVTGGHRARKHRWDHGLDRDIAQEVKKLAAEEDILPGDYLTQHPELYERAKAKKQAKRVAKAAEARHQVQKGQ